MKLAIEKSKWYVHLKAKVDAFDTVVETVGLDEDSVRYKGLVVEKIHELKNIPLVSSGTTSK